MKGFAIDEYVLVLDITVRDSSRGELADGLHNLLEDEKSSFFGETFHFADELVEISDVLELLHDKNVGCFSFEKVDGLNDSFTRFSSFEVIQSISTIVSFF